MTEQPPAPDQPESQPSGRPDTPAQPDAPISPWAPPGPTQPWGAPVQPPPPPPAPPAWTPPPAAATAWPQSWGAPPPVWQPTPAEPGGPGGGRRNMLLFGAVMLAVGLGVGAVVTAATVSRGNNSGNSTPLIANTNPMASGAAASADVVTVAQNLGPAVGTIIAKHPVSANDALGSGFVISHDGSHSFMLTNNHVVAGSTSLNVIMPGGKNLSATVVGTDTFDDLAVISVPDSSLPTAVFGDSSQLKVGQQVVAIGSPLGNEGSVTAGIISSLHRTINAGGEGGSGSETLQDVLQTDASINPGNSGGPLADLEGRVVGVNVAVAGNASNIGFSIPSVLAMHVADDLINHRTPGHPFLGISYLTSIDAVEQGQGFDGPGVLITTVADGSPASQAGFRVNDILVAVDNVNIDNGQTLGGLIQRHKVGDKVDFTLKRGDQVVHASATLVNRPASAG